MIATEATHNTHIKVCGITNVPDALAAVEAGADFLGLIFVPESPRSIHLEAARQVAEAIRTQSTRPVRLVGVFQNQSQTEVIRIVETAGLDMAQLHGQESPEFCQSMPVPVIMTLVLDAMQSEAEMLSRMVAYQSSCVPNISALLVDLPKQPSAAPGKPSIASTPIPHSVLERLRSIYWLAAGGLNPDNVKDAIQRFSPNGVDVASGIEQSPGQKDLTQLRRFCDNVRAAQVITESLGEAPSWNH